MPRRIDTRGDVDEGGRRDSQHTRARRTPAPPLGAAEATTAAEDAVADDAVVQQRVRAQCVAAVAVAGATPQREWRVLPRGIEADAREPDGSLWAGSIASLREDRPSTWWWWMPRTPASTEREPIVERLVARPAETAGRIGRGPAFRRSSASHFSVAVIQSVAAIERLRRRSSEKSDPEPQRLTLVCARQPPHPAEWSRRVEAAKTRGRASHQRQDASHRSPPPVGLATSTCSSRSIAACAAIAAPARHRGWQHRTLDHRGRDLRKPVVARRVTRRSSPSPTACYPAGGRRASARAV